MPTRDQLEDEAALSAALARRKPPPGIAAAPLSFRKERVGLTEDLQSFRLAVGRIRVDGDQVRKHGKGPGEAETRQLAESIREHGLLQPIDVRWLEAADSYEIVAGERRFLAVKDLLRWRDIPVRVLNVPDDQVVWLQLHENLQRKELHPLDLADAIQAATRQGRTQEQVAARLCKSPTYVQKALTVAKKLTQAARALLSASRKAIGLDAAYEIAILPPVKQEALARAVAEQGLPRAELRRLAAETREASPAEARTRPGRPAGAKPYRRVLPASHGASVTVRFRKAKATTAEVIQALREALGAVEAERGSGGR